MELRYFWKIFKRRWWLIAVPAIVVAVVSLFSYRPPPPTGYNVGVNFIVSQEPAEDSTNLDENQYYNWLDSEYIAGGIKDWANGSTFKTAVSDHLATKGIEIPAQTFHVVADNVRSKVQLSIQHGDADTLARIMDAALEVVAEQNAEALPQLGGETAVIVLVDQPVVTPLSQSLRAQLDIPLRLTLALIAGLGLVLLVEYFDTTIHDREEVENMDLKLLGEIPKK